MALKILRVLGNAVGHVMFHPVPYEFGWIQFRGIPREEVGMNLRVRLEELLDRSRLVRATPVPKEDIPSFEASQQMAQEGQDLGIPQVRGQSLNLDTPPVLDSLSAWLVL